MRAGTEQLIQEFRGGKFHSRITTITGSKLFGYILTYQWNLKVLFLRNIPFQSDFKIAPTDKNIEACNRFELFVITIKKQLILRLPRTLSQGLLQIVNNRSGYFGPCSLKCCIQWSQNGFFFFCQTYSHNPFLRSFEGYWLNNFELSASLLLLVNSSIFEICRFEVVSFDVFSFIWVIVSRKLGDEIPI